MKKKLSLILAMFTVLALASLTACSGNNSPSYESGNDPQNSTQSSVAETLTTLPTTHRVRITPLMIRQAKTTLPTTHRVRITPLMIRQAKTTLPTTHRARITLPTTHRARITPPTTHQARTTLPIIRRQTAPSRPLPQKKVMQ